MREGLPEQLSCRRLHSADPEHHSPSVLDDLRSDLQDALPKSTKRQAFARQRDEPTPDVMKELEGERREQGVDLVVVERGARQARVRFVHELSDGGLGASPLTVALQDVVGCSLRSADTGAEEEEVVEELALSAVLLHEHRHHAPFAGPCARLVPELERLRPRFIRGLIARPAPLGRSEPLLTAALQALVRAEPSYPLRAAGIQPVEEVARGEASVDAYPDHLGEGLDSIEHWCQDLPDVVSRMDITGALLECEQIAGMSEYDERVQHRITIVTVVGCSFLSAVHNERQGVDIEHDLLGHPVVPQASHAHVPKKFPQLRQVGAHRERVRQPRQRRLRSKSSRFAHLRGVERSRAAPLRDGHTKRWIAPQRVSIILISPSLGDHQHSSQHQLRHGVRDERGVARVPGLAERLDHAQLFCGLPQGKDACILRQRDGSGLDTYGSAEVRPEEDTLISLTHATAPIVFFLAPGSVVAPSENRKALLGGHLGWRIIRAQAWYSSGFSADHRWAGPEHPDWLGAGRIVRCQLD